METSILGLNNFCFRSSCSLRLWQWTWTSATLYALDVVILAALSPLPNPHHLSTLFWLNNYQRGQPDLSRDQRRDNVMPVQHTASLICSSISFGELYLSISLALCVPKLCRTLRINKDVCCFQNCCNWIADEIVVGMHMFHPKRDYYFV